MENKILEHKLSVVVPAYRQEKTIEKDIRRIERILRQIRYPYEMIVVVDGSESKTKNILRSMHPARIKLYTYPKNQGKGYAVRFGMSKARGDYIAFIDAGMEIDPNGLSMLLEHLEWYDADIIVGSKRHPASVVNYPFSRKILSTAYQLMTWFLFRLYVKDTQVGIKLFKRRVLKKILPRLLVKRYAFDLEMLAVAHYLGFRRIYEAPIKLHYNFSDLVHAATWKEIIRIIIDTLAIFYRIHIYHYYDNKRWNKRDKTVKQPVGVKIQ